jgi:hypothetical protein
MGRRKPLQLYVLLSTKGFAQMGQLPDDIGFEEWIRHIFEHEAAKPAWHWEDDAPYWNCDAIPDRTVEYLNRLFLQSGSLSDSFSPDQIGQGFWYLSGSSCSNYMHALLDEKIDFQSRLKCIAAINVLFEKCFATVCDERMSHVALAGEKRTSRMTFATCSGMWSHSAHARSSDQKKREPRTM